MSEVEIKVEIKVEVEVEVEVESGTTDLPITILGRQRLADGAAVHQLPLRPHPVNYVIFIDKGVTRLIRSDGSLMVLTFSVQNHSNRYFEPDKL